MSTRSAIGIKNNNREYKVIYCHNDGYLEGVGETLLQNYSNIEKIEKLLELGNLSSLGSEPISNPKFWALDDINNPNFDEKEFFDFLRDNADKECSAYKDRGEEDTEAKIFTSIDEIRNYFDDCDYYYIFDKNKNEWFWFSWENSELKPLKDVFQMEEKLEEKLLVENEEDDRLISQINNLVKAGILSQDEAKSKIDLINSNRAKKDAAIKAAQEEDDRVAKDLLSYLSQEGDVNLKPEIASQLEKGSNEYLPTSLKQILNKLVEKMNQPSKYELGETARAFAYLISETKKGVKFWEEKGSFASKAAYFLMDKMGLEEIGNIVEKSDSLGDGVNIFDFITEKLENIWNSYFTSEVNNLQKGFINPTNSDFTKYSDEYSDWDQYLATKEAYVTLTDKLSAFIDRGLTTEDHIQSELEDALKQMNLVSDDVYVEVSSSEVNAYNLTQDEVERVEDEMESALDNIENDLEYEYGDPMFDYESDVDTGDVEGFLISQPPLFNDLGQTDAAEDLIAICSQVPDFDTWLNNEISNGNYNLTSDSVAEAMKDWFNDKYIDDYDWTDIDELGSSFDDLYNEIRRNYNYLNNHRLNLVNLLWFLGVEEIKNLVEKTKLKDDNREITHESLNKSKPSKSRKLFIFEKIEKGEDPLRKYQKLSQKQSKKKGYRGWWVNLNAGDPAKNISFFNHIMGSDKAPTATADGGIGAVSSSGDSAGASGASGAMGEQLKKDKNKAK